MKILVTGAAGFIGSHMAEKLASFGYNVTGVDNLSDYYFKELKLLNVDAIKNRNVHFIEADLRQPQHYKNFTTDVDYIFHFAAQPGLSQTSTFEEYASNNITATQKLVEFAKQCSALKMFVNISTSSVYGADATRNESAVTEPVSFYGVTKLAAEQLVLSESRNNKLKACSLRLYSVYGPRERPDKLYTKLIRSALYDEPFTLIEGSLQHKRSYSFIDDVISGIAAVTGNENVLNNEVINIGSDVQHTTAFAIETVEKLTGKKIRFNIMQKRSGDQLNTKAITGKAKRLLNFTASTSLQNGIRQQIEWFEKIQAVQK